MDPLFAKVIAERKIAEDRAWAAGYGLALEADRARREARQPAGPPLAGLLRRLARVARFGGPAQRARLAGRMLAAIDSGLRALGEAVVFPDMM
jgi:hypothetical protein